MNERTIYIDVDRLRKDMRDDDLGAYFGAGFGGGLVGAGSVDKVTPEKLVEMAQNQGIDLKKYQV